VSPRRRLTREESKARTRGELLRAASRLFLRNGFVATSLADIAEEAGLTKGAVYSNFESKEDLFLALLQEWEGKDWDGKSAEPWPSEIDVPSGASVTDKAHAWADHVKTSPALRRHVGLFLELNSFALRNDRGRAWVHEHNEVFFERLGAELARLFETPDADPYTLGLLAQSMTVGLQMHTAFDSVDRAEVFHRAFELLASAARELDSAGVRRGSAR